MTFGIDVTHERSLGVVSPLAARDGIGANDVNADGAPGAIADFVGRTIRERVNRAEVGDDAVICASQIL